MIDQPSREEKSESTYNQYTEEFLDALLMQEPVYPWNPMEEEVDAYFAQSEEDLSLVDCLESEEITSMAETFFLSAHQCWQTHTNSQIINSLHQRFGDLVPHPLLEEIATAAGQIFAADISPMDKLVKCVEPLLSAWDALDLQVFARPLVCAMRDNISEPTESATLKLGVTPWDERSETQQARLIVAIAHYSLLQLQAESQN